MKNIENNKTIWTLWTKFHFSSSMCEAPVIFLCCWCSKVVRFMLWVKNDIQLCHWKVTSSVWTIFLLRSSAWCRQLLLSHITQYPTTPQHSTIWKVMWLVEKLTPDRSYRYSIMDPYWYVYELHCKYIDCQKYNFSWCNVSHALPVPFGHLITVPSTVDKWYFQLYFWKYFLYHTDKRFSSHS